MAKKRGVSAEVLPTKTVPRAFFENASPKEIAELLIDQGLEKSAAVVAVLLEHYGPVLGSKADRIVEKAQRDPNGFAKDLVIGALGHLLK